MEKKFWFRAKTYGWGWVPVSWEGWLVVALYALCVFVYIRSTVDRALDGSGSGVPLYYHVLFVLATCILIGVSYRKGEKPCWRWGKKKD